jgi:twitching motility protein PilT
MQFNLIDLLDLSVAHNASDVHLSPGELPIVRLDGELMRLPEFINYIEKSANLNDINLRYMNFKDINTEREINTELEINTADFLLNTLTPLQLKELESKKELDFSLTLPEVGNFRVNTFHHKNGISIALRIIPENLPQLEHLSISSAIKELLKLSSGLILVTGATGCGKSTTLATMIDYINTHKTYHIITLEDPIEFVHCNKKSLIHQRQISRDSNSFSAALRSALREDPDIILIGEMRDLETMRLALTAAETGHLVLASMHASSAPRAVSRLIDAFPANEKSIIRNLISESLQAVITQTLVKKEKGGRMAAFEVMLGSPAVRNLIREDKIAQIVSVMQTGSRLGMCTMEQSLTLLSGQ